MECKTAEYRPNVPDVNSVERKLRSDFVAAVLSEQSDLVNGGQSPELEFRTSFDSGLTGRSTRQR